jgi:hypothetical protein
MIISYLLDCFVSDRVIKGINYASFWQLCAEAAFTIVGIRDGHGCVGTFDAIL